VNSLIVTLDPVTAALGMIGPNGLTVSKDSKQDRKIVRVKVLPKILLMVVVTTALNPRTVKVNSQWKKDPALKRIRIAIGVIGPISVLVLGIVIAAFKLVRDNVFVMGRQMILLIVLILDLAVTLLVICPLLLLVMDLLLSLFLVMLSLVVLGVILLNGLLVINPVVAIVDDLQFVPVCLDTPQPPLIIVIPIQPINLATSMTIVPNQYLRMEVIHFLLIVVQTFKMIAVVLNQLVATLPTVTEEMVAITIHHLPLKIVKVVNLHHSHLILIISFNVSVLNPMKKKNVIQRPVDSKYANGICGLNGLNVINFATVLNFVDNCVTVVMI